MMIDQLEPHTDQAVEQMGREAPSWYPSASGLFLDAPHLYLMTHHWHAAQRAATTRYYIVEASSGEVTRYAQSMQAYSRDAYRALLRDVSFSDIRFYAALTGQREDAELGLCVITARRP